MFPDLTSTRFQPRRYCPGGVGNWSGHLPFAADLIACTKPSLVVELGTHYGESYFSFCQAIQQQEISCRAFAVDTWKGDSQTGLYSSAVFAEVSAHNAEHYGSFSTLLPMSFDEALSCTHFADGTIDLLHLDGCHTYDAIKHDFEGWLPKVAAGGIILIHDISVQRDNFGAPRFWEEVSARFPSFAFHHSCGLGVIANSEAEQLENPFLTALFGGKCNPRVIRDYYVLCAERLHYAFLVQAERALTCQVFSPDATGYSEERSSAVAVSPGEWTSVEVDLPVPNGRLRLDPVNCVSAVEVSEIVVESPSAGNVLWSLDPGQSDHVLCAGTAIRMPEDGKVIILSYSDDPQLYLPPFEIPEADGSIHVRFSLRIHRDFRIVEPLLVRYSEACSAASNLEVAHARAQSDLARLRADYNACAQFRQEAEAEVVRMRSMLNAVSQRSATDAAHSREDEAIS